MSYKYKIIIYDVNFNNYYNVNIYNDNNNTIYNVIIIIIIINMIKILKLIIIYISHVAYDWHLFNNYYAWFVFWLQEKNIFKNDKIYWYTLHK